MLLTILLFLLGLAVGFFFASYVILPLLYGLPKAIYWVVKGRLKRGAIWFFVIRFAFGNIVLFLVATFLVFLFPSAAHTLFTSGGFFLGQWAVIGMLFIYGLTNNGRKDLDGDFWKSVGGKYLN